MTRFWIFPTKIGTGRKYGKRCRSVRELSCPVFTPKQELLIAGIGTQATAAANRVVDPGTVDRLRDPSNNVGKIIKK